MKKFLGNKLPNREYNDNIQNSLKTIGNFKLDWTIIDGLKLSSVFGVEYQHHHGSLYYSRQTLAGMLDGKPVEMPPKEIELLYFLASRPGKVFTREQLLEQVWGFDFFGDSRTVDVHVNRIREKLGERDEWQLKTVWGVGYKFDVAK